MRVTFLLTWADGMGGTEHAAMTQAQHLAARQDVEVISVFRTRPRPFFDVGEVGIRYLVDATTSVQRPIRASDLDDAECLALTEQASELIERSWEGSFNRLSDVEMRHALQSLDTDVLITTTPALTAAAVDLVRPEIIVIEQEHRPSQFRGATGEPLLLHAPYLDALVALTERTTQWLSESLGDAAPRLLTIPNAVPEGFRPRSSTMNPVLVMGGRLVSDKRFEHAIDAFDLVADEHPAWSLRIFGEGPEKNRLQRRVDSLGRGDRIVLPGSSPTMSDEWARAGLMALSSKDGEAMPLVLLEAFAAGVPAVAYDIATGPAEIIRHEVDGLLVPAGDVEALAFSLSRLMADDVARARLGEAAFQRAQDFSAAVIVPRWEQLMRELLNDRTSPERLSRRADRAGRRAARGTAGFHPSAPAERVSGWRDDQQDREREIARGAAGLVRSGGRLAEVRDETLHHEMVRENLALVVDALVRAGIDHVVVPPDTGTSRVAIEAEKRPAAIEAVAKACSGQAVYAELLSPRLQRPGTVLAETLPADLDVKGLRVFRPVVTTSRTLRYGPGLGCDLEFWGSNPIDATRTAPLRATSRGRSLPDVRSNTELNIGGRSYRTRSELTVRDTHVVDAPIDAVWTWVDDSDPVWEARLAERRRGLGLPEREPDHEKRFRNRDELRYSLRSVAMYAPWIRHHYLVTDDQVPDWLDVDAPGLTVVSHRDIFDDRTALPTFNSHAIGSQLHHIDGLSEQFLVFNDDIFLGRPLAPEQFFGANGTAVSFPSPTQVPLAGSGHDDADYFAARKNARTLVEAAFGRTLTHGYLHTPHAVLRSLLTELEERFPAEWRRTAGSPFRSVDDVTIVSALHHEYGYLAGRVTRGRMRVSYVDTSRAVDQAVLMRILTQRNVDVLCLNDGSEGEVPASEQARLVRTFLASYLPVPGPFER